MSWASPWARWTASWALTVSLSKRKAMMPVPFHGMRKRRSSCDTTDAIGRGERSPRPVGDAIECRNTGSLFFLFELGVDDFFFRGAARAVAARLGTAGRRSLGRPLVHVLREGVAGLIQLVDRLLDRRGIISVGLRLDLA